MISLSEHVICNNGPADPLEGDAHQYDPQPMRTVLGKNLMGNSGRELLRLARDRFVSHINFGTRYGSMAVEEKCWQRENY